jgi:arsenite methyltransferase
MDETRMTIDYGQDAPGLLRGFFVGGSIAAGLAGVAEVTLPGLWATGAAILLGLAAIYLLGLGSFMIRESRVGKVRDRDILLSRLPWRGDEQVLDVGCGRGLMLLGAATRLTTGQATGIDLWRTEDQAANSADATLANAAALGVAGRVSVVTGDMTDMPFPADRFDIVLSAWAVHNVPDPSRRKQAIGEMLRVLKPGGMLALTDIEGRDSYPEALQALGALEVSVAILHPFRDKMLSALTFGSFAPFTVLARKPG